MAALGPHQQFTALILLSLTFAALNPPSTFRKWGGKLNSALTALLRNTFEGLDFHAQESSNLSLHDRTFVASNTPRLMPDSILEALHHGAMLIQHILMC